MKTKTDIKPIFIFSLPRAGSTLLQRIISKHDKVSSVAEPWLLLNCFYALKKSGCSAEYNHFEMQRGIEDFCQHLQNGEVDYRKAIRHFALELYGMASSQNAEFFLDKTPRYSLIAEEIIETFPDGKYIFLWRNPLAIAASMMETWSAGKWNLHYMKIDLYEGLEKLIMTHERYQPCMSCRYEDLILYPESEVKRILEYLNLEYYSDIIKGIGNSKMKGRMGDPTGVHQYDSVSDKPLNKWKKTLCNPLRKSWARRYLAWIGAERLAVMGYDLDLLLEELNELPFSLKFFFSDCVLLPYAALYHFLDLPLLRKKISGLSKWHKMVAYK